MTFRSKGGLRDRVAIRFPDNDQMLITPAHLREILGDLIDSYQQGMEALPVLWGRVHGSDVNLSLEERTALITPNWVRAGTRVEGERLINLPGTNDAAYVAFYLPTALIPRLIGYPRLQGSNFGQAYSALSAGLVGNVGYTVWCGTRRIVFAAGVYEILPVVV